MPSLSQENPLLTHLDDASLSDYGSDISDTTASTLLSPPLALILEPILLDPPPQQQQNAENHDTHFAGAAPVGLARVRTSSRTAAPAGAAKMEIEYDAENRRRFAPSPSSTTIPTAAAAVLDVTNDTEPDDLRSPLQRFRTAPKKPLSVTDLVSPAWCEQQYLYSLSKYGRVRATPAMRQGSSVHGALEAEVHVRVPVEVVSPEDRFGLRVWNSIQGVRGLRETGLTRELEVWGLLPGEEVVVGVIDEVTDVCPDEGMEASLRDGKEVTMGEQRTLREFMTAVQGGSTLEGNKAFLGTLQEKKKKATTFYVVDIKTRQSRTLPATAAPSRPTHMQLMIYHRLLSALARNEVPGDKIFARYGLDPHAPFSDKFIAELANLDIRSFATQDSEEGAEDEISTQRADPLTELLEHNTLSSLWELLVSEFAQTFPPTLGSESSISPLLTAEFRTAASTADAEAGTLIGRRSFAFDARRVDAYVADELRWWRGERATQGVDVEEAYKCRMCEFAENCTWRATKIEEGIQKARLRREARKKSNV